MWPSVHHGTIIGIIILAKTAEATPTPEEMGVAREHFALASAAEDQGRWKEAIQEIDKAIHIKETAGLRYHLGYCEENLGQLVEAMLEYERAAGLVSSGAVTEDVERFVTPKLAEMHQRVPRLTVRIPTDVKDPSLQIDGVPVRSDLFGFPIPLNPGNHALAVFAPGRRAAHIQVRLGEGATVTHVVELVPEAVVSSTLLATSEASKTGYGTSRTVVQLGLLGVGVAGLALGAIEAFNVTSKNSNMLARCPNQNCTSDEAYAASQEDHDAAATARAISMIGFGVGRGTRNGRRALSYGTFETVRERGRLRAERRFIAGRRGHIWALVVPEVVNEFETGAGCIYCIEIAVGASPVTALAAVEIDRCASPGASVAPGAAGGGLIHTAVGSEGAVGAPCVKRSGWAA